MMSDMEQICGLEALSQIEKITIALPLHDFFRFVIKKDNNLTTRIFFVRWAEEINQD